MPLSRPWALFAGSGTSHGDDGRLLGLGLETSDAEEMILLRYGRLPRYMNPTIAMAVEAGRRPDGVDDHESRVAPARKRRAMSDEKIASQTIVLSDGTAVEFQELTKA
jgi:hypothetical protein